MEQLVLVGLGCWVVWQAWRGYREGLWVSILAILGFILAYVACILFGQKAGAWLAAKGIPDHYAVFIAYPLIFIVVSALVKHLPVKLIPALKTDRMEKGRKAYRYWGACLGAVTGVVTGLFAVWLISIVQVALISPDKTETASEMKQATKLEQVASSFVAKTASVGAKAMGAPEEKVVAMSAALQQPKYVMQGMQAAMKTQEMQQLLQAQNTQKMMALNDVNSLQNSTEFQHLLRVPSVQNLVKVLEKDQKSAEGAEYFLAEQLTFVWRRMAYLKHDSRAQAILEDVEFQKKIQGGNPIQLLADPQFQKLVSLVMEGTPDLDEATLNQALLKAVSGEDISELELNRSSFKEIPHIPQSIYKWRDDRGKLQFSDWESIPQHLRSSATELKR